MREFKIKDMPKKRPTRSKLWKADNGLSYMSFPGTDQSYLFPESQSKPPHIIENIVCGYFGERIEDVRKKCRKRNLVVPRMVVMFLMRRHTEWSLKNIGDLYNKDHTTVIHSITTVLNLMQTDEKFKKQVAEIESVIQ